MGHQAKAWRPAIRKVLLGVHRRVQVLGDDSQISPGEVSPQDSSISQWTQAFSFASRNIEHSGASVLLSGARDLKYFARYSDSATLRGINEQMLEFSDHLSL